MRDTQPTQPQQIARSLEEIGEIKIVSLWSCAAHCQDGADRDVVGLFQDGHCLFISRPWIGPVQPPILRHQLKEHSALLTALLMVADYRLSQGTWYGEIAAPRLVLAASGMFTRPTFDRHLKRLIEEGVVHHHPAPGAADSWLLRIYPFNRITGQPILRVEPSWLRSFLVKIEPKVLIAEARIANDNVYYKDLTAPVAQPDMAATIENAPLVVSKPDIVCPKPPPLLPGNADLVDSVRGLPGFEDAVNLTLGLDPCLISDDGQVADLKLSKDHFSDWETWWSQDGLRVEVETELNVSNGPCSTWAAGGIQAIENIDVLDNREPLGSLSLNSRLREPRVGFACGETAAAPPPPSAPPAANTLHLWPPSKRQLQPRQVVVIHQQRGPRLPWSARIQFRPEVLACVEDYERLGQVPFCAADLPLLEQALSIARNPRCVRRAIADCALRYPEEKPGYYLVRDGMAHVLNTVQASPVYAKALPKVRKPPPTKAPKSPTRSRSRSSQSTAPTPSFAACLEDKGQEDHGHGR